MLANAAKLGFNKSSEKFECVCCGVRFDAANLITDQTSRSGVSNAEVLDAVTEGGCPMWPDRVLFIGECYLPKAVTGRNVELELVPSRSESLCLLRCPCRCGPSDNEQDLGSAQANPTCAVWRGVDRCGLSKMTDMARRVPTRPNCMLSFNTVQSMGLCISAIPASNRSRDKPNSHSFL